MCEVQSKNENKINNTDMVEKEIKFSDGTRIFYEEVRGRKQRFIEYSLSPHELEKIKEKPILKSFYDTQIRKYNAGKYYYLDVLSGIVCGLSETQKNQLYNELKELHDKVGREYDPNILGKSFLATFGKYWKDNNAQCAAFFATIYLAMLDLEANKDKYPNSLGKTMVLRSCRAVILEGKDPREAAVMLERKREEVADDYYYDSEVDSRYEKYNGYNGYDDDTIDIGFDGHPEATWNVD